MSNATAPPGLERAHALLRNGDRTGAVLAAKQALRPLTSDPEVLLRAATTVYEMGLPQVAESAFRRALHRNPASADWRYRWAVFRLVTGFPADALAEVDSLLATHDSPDLHALRGLSLRRLGRTDEAARAYQDALRGDPERIEWWNHVGDMRLDQRRLEDAIRAYNAALVAAGRRKDAPPRIVAYSLLRLADCFAKNNMVREAWRFSESALELTPADPRARWNDLHLLPIIYETEGEVAEVRQRYGERLDRMIASLDLTSPLPASRAVAGMKLPFYLHYQGGDMRPIMERYGRVVGACMQAWRPDLAEPPDPPLPVNGKFKVGFCSYLFRRHTVSKLFNGWIRELDRSRFEVHAYHLGPEMDETTAGIRAAVDHFEHLVGADAATVCTRMREQGLHAVIFPELGMATTPYQVAALRAAPIQAVGWGHPITTGLDTVDLFLSSEAMEPDNGQEHYTEELVRLPGLSITPSRPIAPSSRDRASFGLAADDVVFLVPQSLFKLLPDGDDVFARILAQVPRGRLVFLHNQSEVVTGLFNRRLSQALAARGVEPESRIVFLPQLDWADYLALNGHADVFLDGLTWSGGMTTLEAISQGLVPVTLPGEVMRARHTAAILSELGDTSTVASDVDQYVEIAVALARDPAGRKALGERLQRALPRIYDDPRPTTALEGVLESALARWYASRSTRTKPINYQRKPTLA